ncbi:hypothetical protein AURANDRAFT_65982 [Aureococcus anophagefferens]|uniref:Sugar phosphate transporter domain-containing protein n=1 Tax=Aureococcus anophagefferens TaxID=44056 RepID=F0YFX3_AURAN|nr:hypothetical protein AURANDRAFT_65982 [Aureococcus anophagefferens]EGB06032.1 hypothetical protein AURANDRAFT_65982 [Aureococcus anophagefferens]|eukprot:XP_009039288.1 hypothetical protein AURANDRAFT_65982 [Aureococcus anophagefferens]
MLPVAMLLAVAATAAAAADPGKKTINVFYPAIKGYEDSRIGLDMLLTFVAPYVEKRGYALASVPYNALDELTDERPYAAGDVVVYAVRAEVASRAIPGGDYAVNKGCAYTFTEDALLAAPNALTLLEETIPLTLLDASDWNCQSKVPRTIHNSIRTSSGANGVMDFSTLMPFGVEYDSTEFLTEVGKARDVGDRRFAFSISEHTSYRKPSRVDLLETFSSSADRVSSALRGREYIFDLFNELSDEPTTHDTVYGLDYMEMLGDSIFVLCPAGDEYIAGCAVEALEYGAVPIMENPPSFKGCSDPVGYYERLGLRLTVKSWGELPGLLAYHFDRDDADDHLARLQAAVVAWHDAWKDDVADLIVAFKEDAATRTARNDCARVELSDAQKAQIDADFDAYYAQDHWYDNFRDSAWAPGSWCSKYESIQLGLDDDLRDTGCFDKACAPVSYAGFACGGGDAATNLAAAPEWLLHEDWVWYATKVLLWVLLICCARLFAVEFEAFERVAKRVAAAASGDADAAGAAATFRQAAAEALLMVATVANLIGLTFLNNYVMSETPYAATLTTLQMAASTVVACSINAARGRRLFGSVSLRLWATKVLPLAALFGVYLFTSNLVYRYLDVGFIQMLKPVNGIMLFVLSFGLGIDGRANAAKLLNAFVITGAVTAVAVGKAEIDPDGVTYAGLAIMAVSTVTAALYQTGIQLLMQRPGDERIDPVTMLAVMAPTTTLFLATYALATEWTDPEFVANASGVSPLAVVADVALSVCLDLNKNLIIGLLSAVAYCLVGYTKDVLIVVIAATAGREAVGATQWEAYALLCLGQLVWTVKKMAQRLAADETLPLKKAGPYKAAKIADSQPQLGALSDCKIDPQIAALFPKRHAPDRQDSTDGAADATLEDDAALWSFVGEAGPKK